MRVLVTLAVMLLTVAVATPSAAEGFALTDADQVVFLGDTLVSQGLFPHFVETFVRARYPELRARFLMMGRADATPQSLREVVEKDVLGMEPRPTVAVICVGLFEVSMAQLSDEQLVSFASDYEELVRVLTAAGIKVVVLTPPSPDEERNARLRELAFDKQVVGRIAAEIRRIAAAHGAALADWYRVSAEQRAARREQDPRFSFSRDGLRPQGAGHALAATLLLEQWGAQPIAARVKLDWASGEITSTAGSVTAERLNRREVKVTLHDFPLPWVLTAGRGEHVTPDWYAHRLCAITVKISGLPSATLVLEAGRRPLPLVREQVESGFDLGSCAALLEAPAAERLIRLVNTKNRLFSKRWVDARAKKPSEPELAEAFAALMHSYDLYHQGYAALIDRCPRTLDLEMTFRLTEGKPITPPKATLAPGRIDQPPPADPDELRRARDRRGSSRGKKVPANDG